MIRNMLKLRGIAQDRKGAVLTEFAMLLPVMAMLLLGAMDAGHTLYMQATLQGALQKASRDAGLESGITTASQTAIDDKVKNQVKALAKNATITITRRAYRSFAAASATKEQFTDTNNNGTCNGGEPYEDDNNNSVWDAGGVSGAGGAESSVLYTVTATYSRLFPMYGLIGMSPTVTVTGSTLMNNQPFGDRPTTTVRNCP
jgi:Flp pilus assembly protein TadG